MQHPESGSPNVFCDLMNSPTHHPKNVQQTYDYLTIPDQNRYTQHHRISQPEIYTRDCDCVNHKSKSYSDLGTMTDDLERAHAVSRRSMSLKRTEYASRSVSVGNRTQDGDSASPTRSGGSSFRSSQQNLDGISLAEKVGLSAYQQELVTKSWPKVIAPGGLVIGNGIVRGLMERSNVSKGLFCKTRAIEAFSVTSNDIHTAHALLIVELLEFTVKSFQEPVKVVYDRCIEIGISHKHLCEYGLTSGAWHDLADTMQELMYKNETIRKHKMLMKAWNLIITFIIDWILEGMQGHGQVQTP